ncbi:hypothetical protein HAP47_0032450 [Bradyrhizobium sp. 41S5]|uniref:hypothetical protein n=1 Tax=Bradyrhizobium sp. 41S5 TaxID=1404443 RepID=UPI00156AA136|nr:hypothetical protein [Bradyrhizobium sp. 41S5]UFX43883.1 hypothetical protein HAP47_0032450 [Bradyrhizobium sp. 41S5]
MTLPLLVASRREAKRSALLERQLRRYHPHVQGKIRALAMRHTRLADLAASFPALLLALAVPRTALDPARAITRVIDGQSLADAAAAAGIPLWLRRLPPEAFTRPITELPDDELFRRQIANHLPQLPRLAPIWLQSVATVAELAHAPAAVWIARELVRVPPRTDPARLRLVSLWTWFSTQPTTLGHTLIDRRWTPNMQIGSALAAANAWRTMVALHVSLGSQPIADMWLQPGHVAGYHFIPLNSTADIAEEAEAMQNCLRTYGSNLAHNRSRLWSVRRCGQRVATLRIAVQFADPLPSIVELNGIRNTAVPREVWWAARQWLHAHDLLRIDIAQRKWGTAPLDRPTWRAIWRPYWLAKRQIPEWLPLAPSRRVLNAL